ncbi:MAG: hypothetical protein ACLGI5_16635 [Thermoleophilia bacterium]
MAWRTVVVQMWTGPRVIARAGPTAGLTDAQITDRLRGLNITIPATPAGRLARLEGYPTDPDLRALERRLHGRQRRCPADCPRARKPCPQRARCGWVGAAMIDLEPLLCIVCVRREDPMSDEADGWVLVPRSVDQGDEHDDSQWKCPACVSASEEFFADPIHDV